MMMDGSLFVKILVVGDSEVGKTSILNQYCYDKFDVSVNPTIGCDFCLKVLNFQGKKMRLQLWDIAGQDRYAAVSRLYVKGATGCLVVADIMNPESLKGALKWKEVIEENADLVEGQTIPIFLIQNKYDLLDGKGKKEEFQKPEYLASFAQKNGFKGSFQVSAKLDINLDKSIEALLNEILKMNLIHATRDNFSKPANVKITNSTRINDGLSGKDGLCLC